MGLKTGFLEHLTAAILVLAVLAIFSGGASFGWIPLYAAFLLGSVAPDVDHPNSKIRRWAEASAFAVVFSFLIFFAWGKGAEWIAISLALAFVFVRLFGMLIPGHRKFLHSPAASVIFGFCVGAVCVFALGAGSAIATGLAGACGYLLHIAVDRLGDIL